MWQTKKTKLALIITHYSYLRIIIEIRTNCAAYSNFYPCVKEKAI